MNGRYMRACVTAAACGLLVIGLVVLAQDPATRPATTNRAADGAPWAPAVKPKPLSDNVQAALRWLVKAQHENGGWSQGEESQQMGQAVQAVRDLPNVADTCAACLALIRAGSTPSQGPHAESIQRGLAFICSQIEESEPQGLSITKVQGTRLQAKLGTYVDTFLAAMLLGEVKDQMPDDKGRKRIIAALDKNMDKIEKNQQQDGTWANKGWAPVLAQGLASKAVNRVAQSGYQVDETVRARAETQARGKLVGAGSGSASFEVDGASAGVALYSYGANLSAIQDSANTNAMQEDKLRIVATTAPSSEARQSAEATLQRFEANAADLSVARKAIVDKVQDERFIAGFGSNGGEEFLSYMNIGESLVVGGGDEWAKWDKSMTENLNRIQNADGSWTGHHCITGKTFCTSAALLVLTVDRAPVPLAAQIKRR